MAFGAIGAGLASSFAAKARQKDAAAAQLHLFKRRHQFETEDLEKAGLNRILGFARGSAPGVGAIGVPSVNFPAPDIMGIPKKIAGASVAARLAEASASTAEHGAKEAKARALTEANRTDLVGEQANQAGATRLMSWMDEQVKRAGLTRDIQRSMTEGKYEASTLGKLLRAWSMGTRHLVGPANIGGSVGKKSGGINIINQRR